MTTQGEEMMVTRDNSAFGLFLRDHLARTETTVEDFAASVDISRTRAYRLRSGTAADKLDPDVAVRLARYLDITVEDLLDLYAGRMSEADVIADEREAMVRRFVLANKELTPEQLRAVLRVAATAADALKHSEGR
jgi:plasmid maintenance system antidote protein VapI